MEIPEHLQHRVAENLAHELEGITSMRAYWDMKIEHEKLEHELRCQKLRMNEQGIQIQ